VTAVHAVNVSTTLRRVELSCVGEVSIADFTTREWIHYILGAIRQTSSGFRIQIRLIRKSGFESRITFGWDFGDGGGVVVVFVVQETQLSQRDRAIEYFATSLKVSQGHSKWHCCTGRVWVLISISTTLCLYVVPFLRYTASKNGVTVKQGVGVVENGAVR